MHGVSSDNNDEQKTPSEISSTVVFMTIADTTWRMFVPTLGFTALGVWLDRLWQTSPWLLFTGIIIGFLVAFFAVRRQIKRLK